VEPVDPKTLGRLELLVVDRLDDAIEALRDLGRQAPSRDLSVAIQYAETAALWAWRATHEEE
jgi:hypothetical protein